jgi:hypothetical protein
MELTTEVLRELLDYHKDTGVFVWKVRERHWFNSEGSFKTWNTRFAAKAAGHLWTSTRGYPSLRIKILGKLHKAHRLAFIWMGEALPDHVDHLNRDSVDNRWSNLSASSAKENAKNMSMKSNNTSGVTGVYWHNGKRKWQAQARLGGERKHLGYFTDLEIAAEAVRAFRVANGFSSGHGKELAKYLEKSVDS